MGGPFWWISVMVKSGYCKMNGYFYLRSASKYCRPTSPHLGTIGASAETNVDNMLINSFAINAHNNQSYRLDSNSIKYMR